MESLSVGLRKRQLSFQINSAMRGKKKKSKGCAICRYLSTEKSSSCGGMGAGSPDVLLEAKSHPLATKVNPNRGRLRLSKMSSGLWSCLRACLGFRTGVWEAFKGERMGNPRSSSVGLPS